MSPANGEPNDLCQVGDVIHTSWGFDQSKATQWKIWGRLMATGHRKRVSASDRCRVRYIPRMSQPDFQRYSSPRHHRQTHHDRRLAGIVRRRLRPQDLGSPSGARSLHRRRAFANFFDSAVNSKMGFVFVDRATGRLIAQAVTTATSPNAARSRSAGRSSPAATGAARPTARSSALMLDHAFTFATPRSSGRRAQLALAGRDDQIGGVQARGLLTGS